MSDKPVPESYFEDIEENFDVFIAWMQSDRLLARAFVQYTLDGARAAFVRQLWWLPLFTAAVGAVIGYGCAP